MTLKEFGNGVDYLFNKVLPKKILVVAVATMIVLKQVETPPEYWWILLAYFGVNIGGTIARNVGKEK